MIKTYIDKAYSKLISTAKKKKVNPEVIEQLPKSRILVAALSEPKEIFDALRAVFPIINDNNL